MGKLSGIRGFAYRSGRRVRRGWHARRTGPRIRSLLKAGDPAAGIARAFQNVQSPDAATREWASRIEAERARLLADGTELVILEGTVVRARMTVAEACAASVAPPAGILLHSLTREFKPTTALELGTNTGISSAYIAAALPAGARLLTLEGSAARLGCARALHARLGLDNVEHRLGVFEETLAPALEEEAQIDFAFIDGNHHLDATLGYFDLICRHSVEQAVFVFDDIRWSKEMRAAWKKLRKDPRVQVAIDVHWMGIIIADQHRIEGLELAQTLELWLERGK